MIADTVFEAATAYSDEEHIASIATAHEHAKVAFFIIS
jgi:hypothetical protein